MLVHVGAPPEGIVAIAEHAAHRLVDKLGDAFTRAALLRHTPRRMAEHGTPGHLVIIEADRNDNDDEMPVAASS